MKVPACSNGIRQVCATLSKTRFLLMPLWALTEYEHII